MTEAIEFIKKQDLAAYLNLTVDHSRLPQPVLCPFHPDKNPSATITCGQDGHWVFCCHSSRCNVKGTIIDLTKMVLNTQDEKQVYRRLFAHYNVVIDTGWKAQQISVLDQNMQVIHDIKTIQTSYPYLHRWIGRVTHDLIDKLKLAKQHVVSERNQVHGNVVFFASLREMKRRRRGLQVQPRHFSEQAERVDRYCALGLMRKLTDEEIPKHLKTDAHHRRIRSGHAYRVQFYTILEYTPALLKEADRRAHLMQKSGASVRGISSTMIVDILGDKIAREVYPQSPKRTRPDRFTQDVEAALKGLVDQKGYGRTRMLRPALASCSEYASVTHRRIEKCLPGILKRWGLKRVTCTKELKTRLGIASSGYPKVIVPAEMYASAGRNPVVRAETERR